MSIPSKIPSTRAEQPSRLDSSEELQSKANALLGPNYRRYTTADKLEIVRIFSKPPHSENASGGQLGKVSEIRARYKEIKGDATPLGLEAFKMVTASLPSYVRPMLFHWKLEEFESALPKVTMNAEDAARRFASLPTKDKLMLYGFSLCRAYVSQLNQLDGLASLYEKLKQHGGGNASAELGYEYKEAFNRKLRTYLPDEQNRVLEELEAEMSYDERRQKTINALESALAKLKGEAVSETSSDTTTTTTTANTTTTTTTTVANTSFSSVSSQRASDIEIKEAASQILEPVNGLNHILRLSLYLQYKAGTTTFPFVNKYEDARLNEFEERLKGKTGKLDNPADRDALLNSVMEEVKNLLPEHLKKELGKINILDVDTKKAEFENLAHSAFINVKAGFRLSNSIQSKCSATAILNMIGYSFDRDENRLSQMDDEEKWQFNYVGDAWLSAKTPMEQQGILCAFIGGVLSIAPEAVQQDFREALLLLNPEQAKEAVLSSVAKYLKDPSALGPFKKNGEATLT
jgi:hypothetical protein